MRLDLGVGDFVRAVKLSYLRAALEELAPEGSRVNVSRISVVTGMTRKEVALFLRSSMGSNAASPPGKHMEQRALRVLRGWTTDPLFQTEAGRPAALEVRGEQRTFSSLVRAYGGDVTPTAVLRELERMNAIARTRHGKLRLRVRSVSPKSSSQSIAEFARVLRDFVDTAAQIITPKDASLFFGYRDAWVSTEEQAALFQRTFSRRAASFLESVEQWKRRQRTPSSMYAGLKRSTARVGLGVYLVQRGPASRTKIQKRRQRLGKSN